MRRVVCGLLLALAVGGSARADASSELAAAVAHFRTDGPKGWSFTQATEAQGESRVERFDAAQPEFRRWTLVRKNGRTPTPAEIADYDEKQSRRSRGGTAPLLTDQLDLTTAERLPGDAQHAVYRCRLKRGERGDATAEHLRATFRVDAATGAIVTLELAAQEPFSPAFGVTIAEMRTTMTYLAPTGDRPSLPLGVTTRLRGRAFLLKSLDADLSVTFSDYERAGKR